MNLTWSTYPHTEDTPITLYIFKNMCIYSCILVGSHLIGGVSFDSIGYPNTGHRPNKLGL